MHFKTLANSLIIITFLMIFSACDVMETFLPFSNSYKLNARVNGTSLDECSFVTVNDKIQPYFEASIAGDPDVTALLVFFRNGGGEITGSKVLYSLDNTAEKDEILVPVKSLDDNLPFIQLPENSPVGRYTMVSQVMRGKEILQKTEKSFYFMGNLSFSLEGINVNFPGFTDNSHIIQRGLVVLLEAKLNFNGQIDPYIVWYNGNRKISEGKYSDGANCLLWKAPEQSGFYSVYAEVFPSDFYRGLSGFKKEVSLLVSTKTMELNLVSDNIPQLVYWYTFEGNLNDSKVMSSQPAAASALASANAERALKATPNTRQQWLPANGTYGLAAGYDRTYTLPAIASDAFGGNNWQTLFRFMPINDGEIFSVQFSSGVSISLNIKGHDLVLTLSSPFRTVSQSLGLYELNAFNTAGVSFSVQSGLISAKINIIGNSANELTAEPISLETNDIDNFQIILGHKLEDNAPVSDKPVFTAIWNEFALFNAPPMEIILADVRKAVDISNSQQDYISSN